MLTSFYNVALPALIAAFYCSGCSQDILSKQEDKSPTQETEDVSEDEVADEPVEVSGAYVKILCAKDGFKVEKTDAQNNIIVSCVIKNADGTRYNYEISNIVSKVSVNNKVVDSKTEISSGPPWHFYVETSAEDRKNISFGEFEIISDGKTEKFETDVFDYKWATDPVFALLVVGLTAKADPERVTETLATLQKKYGQKVQVAFVSDDVFAGNFGVENADAYCDREGKKIIADRSWKALMGSSTQTARERIKIKGPVLNVFGSWVSSIASDQTHEDQFWTEDHSGGFRITQSGKDTNLFGEFNSRLQVIDTVWTGVDYAGSKDTEYGDCNNWTSNDPSLSGGTGHSRDHNGKWIRYLKLSCDSYARIVCINL